MKMDWKNIDFGALLSSQVIRGNLVTIIGLVFTLTGHSLPVEMQTQLTDLLTKLAELLTAVGVMYSSYHRATAQAENVTVIVPKKQP